MAEFTKIGLIYHPTTRKVIRAVFPVEGDHELDTFPEAFMEHLDTDVAWQCKVVDRETMT